MIQTPTHENDRLPGRSSHKTTPARPMAKPRGGKEGTDAGLTTQDLDDILEEDIPSRVDPRMNVRDLLNKGGMSPLTRCRTASQVRQTLSGRMSEARLISSERLDNSSLSSLRRASDRSFATLHPCHPCETDRW